MHSPFIDNHLFILPVVSIFESNDLMHTHLKQNKSLTWLYCISIIIIILISKENRETLRNIFHQMKNLNSSV